MSTLHMYVTQLLSLQVELGITSCVGCAVGKWDLAFDTVKTAGDGGGVTSLMKDSITTHAFILFNAWCKGMSFGMVAG